MNKLILIDSGSVASQARYTTGVLDNGIIFEFLSRILSLYRQFDSRNFAFAFDSKHSLRKRIYPEYKANRKKENYTEKETKDYEDYHKQMGVLQREVLPRMGFKNVFHHRGFEADDIIASIVQGEDRPIVIVSEDADLYQLLRTIPYVAQLQKKELFTRSDFAYKYEIVPALWWKVKALAGCSSDNVMGVGGIGEKTAIKYIKGELSNKSVAYKRIVNGKDDYLLAKKLVKLPFVGTPPIYLKDDELDYLTFTDICKEYQFNSFLRGDQVYYWKAFFGVTKEKGLWNG